MSGGGHVGCCDSSPEQHATKHAHSAKHPIMMSFEPGEDWFWDYEKEAIVHGAERALPHAHPVEQPAPGPAGKVPKEWKSLLK